MKFWDNYKYGIDPYLDGLLIRLATELMSLEETGGLSSSLVLIDLKDQILEYKENK